MTIRFEVGDFIVVGTLAGTVEHVGLKTTRIRSLGGELDATFAFPARTQQSSRAQHA